MLGCLVLIVLAVLGIGAIGSAVSGDDDASACPTVKLTGFPADKDQVTVKAGEATCTGDTTSIPFTATSGASDPVAVTLTLRLTAPDGGHALQPVFIRDELAAGGTTHDTADVKTWGDIDGATELTATVTEFTIGKPDPEPTGDGDDLPDVDGHRPNKCHHKWYC